MDPSVSTADESGSGECDNAQFDHALSPIKSFTCGSDGSNCIHESKTNESPQHVAKIETEKELNDLAVNSRSKQIGELQAQIDRKTLQLLNGACKPDKLVCILVACS